MYHQARLNSQPSGADGHSGAATPELKRFDHTRPLFTPYGLTCEKWFSLEPMPRPDRHNEIEWNFLPEGSLITLLGGQRIEIPPRQLFVFWAARPHQDLEYRTAAHCWTVTIPLAVFLRWQLPADLVHTLLSGAAVLETRPELADLDIELLRRWYDDLLDSRPPLREAVELEMQARLRRLAVSSCRSAINGRGAQHLNVAAPPILDKAEQIALFVAKHCTDRICAADIGRAVGLHPDYAAAIFRKAFGTSLHRHVQENSICHAQYLLTTTDASILDVSLNCGFGSVSRFDAAFKTLCGCTPREYRKRVSSTLSGAASAAIP